MRTIFIFIFALSYFCFNAQIVLNREEKTSREVKDPVSIILTEGFSASSTNGKSFTAKIGDIDNLENTNVNSEAGNDNPSGTVWSHNRFHDTQGNIDVNNSGQLHFTLPIALPPSIKTIAPQVNLVYTSGSSNGIAGYGWSLSGLTAISRMGKTIEKDGGTRGVQLDYSDYFSFNGQRLILKRGEYGKNGAEYVTEKFSNVKIKSLGALSGVSWQGPEYWEVTFEDGSQAWYGGTKAGENAARTPNEYNIVKWKDAQGNYISYQYQQTDNVSRISSISWGGNETLNKSHFNSIQFKYAHRQMKESAYLRGKEYIQGFVLNEIRVLNEGAQFKKYVLQHQSVDGYLRLEHIAEYNAQNEMANPVVFSYQPNTLSSDQNTITQGVKDTHTKKYGDFDFDGVVDFLEIGNNGTLYYKKSVYKEGDAIQIHYNRNEFSLSDFRNSVIITYKNNNIVGNSAGIVVPIQKYRGSSLDIFDYEFRIYAVNLDTKTLEYQYSKTLKYENFVIKRTFDEPQSDCFIYPNTLESLTAYDYDGDGITEVLVEFKFSRECIIRDIEHPIDIYTYNEERGIENQHTHKTNRILLSNNTEYYEEQQQIETPVNYREILPPHDQLLLKKIRRYSTILFDLKQETPYENSFYEFNIEYMEGDRGKRNVFKMADFDGDGIDELYFNENRILRNIINIKKNTSGHYSISLAADNQNIEGLGEHAIVADFNGDGKVDLAVPQAQKSFHWKFYFATGKGFKMYDYTNFIYFSSEKESSQEGKHRNVIFERYCHYGIYTFHQYNAVDLDKDGKAEIVVSKVVVKNHGWNSHHGQESTNVTLRVYSVAKSHNTPIVGNSSSPLKYGLTQEKNFYFGEKVIYFSSLFINRTNQQIVLIGRPDDCPINDCDRTNIIYLDYKNIPTKMRLIGIEQGKLRTDISYEELLPVGGVYQSLESLSYPYMSLKRVNQSYVVSSLKQYTDYGIRKQDFRYRGLTTHLQGKGMIGFRQTARSSWYANGFENTKIWSGIEIDPINDGIPIKEWTIKTNDENRIFPPNISIDNVQLLSVKLIKYQHNTLPNKVKAIVPIQTITKDFQKNITNISNITYDSYYLPTKTVSTTNNSFATTTTDLQYIHNPNGVGNNYFIGRPKSKTELVRVYGDSKGAKEDYEYENNLLKHKISWNENNSGWIKETYAYDGFGNIVQKTISNSVDNHTQTVKSEYDAKGKFVIKKTDNLGLSTFIEYNTWGQITKQTDPLGNIQTNTYDAWGKILTTKTNLGGTTSFLYEKLSNGGVKTIEFSPDGNQTISYTDKIGQKYQSATKAFENGKFIFKQIRYDALGRKKAESEPYFEGESADQWNTIEYDDFSRPIRATSFTGKIVETVYTRNSVMVTETNANNRFKKTVFDALGNTISTRDKGGIIHFKYNARGQNIEAKYGSNIVTTKYDEWGRKKEFHDPSNGTYRYEYKDGFGKITKEISPKGYKQYTYNARGQLISQREITTDGTQNTDKTINYTYNNKGLITAKKGVSKGKTFANYITYDSYGRVLSTSEDSYGRYYMQKGITYDDKNRVISYEKSLYSSGKLTAVTIQNIYSQWSGVLSQIKDKNTGKILWELKNTNAKGQVTKALLGNTIVTNDYDINGFLNNINHHSKASNRAILQVNYHFDAIKNELRSRQTGGDFTIGESFTYDENNRLINWTNPTTGNSHYNIYDKQGRIIENDQLGKVKFENANKIYQATSVTLNPAGEGNLRNNLIQSISYNENNDPVFINGVNGDVRFEYGLSEMRQMVTFGGNINDQKQGKGRYTRYYSEDGSYEVTLDHQTNKEKHIIYIGGSPYESEIVYLKNFNETTGSYKFLHKDYLGSILAISNEAGNKVEQRHYDAWGNLTHLQIGNGSIQIGRLQPMVYGLLLDRGYTSHEHLFEVGLIHMNGRLYDPLLRRFLNADEHIQDPYNTQNYNKYGYVYNNPLMYNDPNGEIAFLAPIFAWVAANAVAIVTAAGISAALAGIIYTIDASINNYWTLGGFTKAVFGGALTGAVSGALGHVFSAGGFWATVGNGALAGAGGGGINALINGQNFLEGLVKGAVIGGAVGAISYGLGKLFNKGRKTVNYEMETTSENTIKVDDLSIQNQNAKEAWQENWKKIYESTKNNKPAYLMKVGKVPKGYIEDPNTGFLINQETGSSSWAVTKTNYKNGIVLKHNLFLSKAALSSKQQLNYVMNHEFGHMVLNNNYGEAINKVIGRGLIDTAAHRAIQVTGSKFLQLNNWSKLNLGGVFKGPLIGDLYPEYGHLKQLEKLIIKIK